MLYAKVVLGLPVDGPFDYIVPKELVSKIKAGSRVRVSFGTRKITGYVVGLSPRSNIKKLKPILDLIDDSALLNQHSLALAGELSDYYCCSWGEAIETSLPESLRSGRRPAALMPKEVKAVRKVNKPDITLVHDSEGSARWDIYLAEAARTLGKGKSVIILLPDIPSAKRAQDQVSRFLDVSASILYRKQPRELDQWLKLKNGKRQVVVGTRSAVFAPVDDLGLIIVDEEEDSVYKQEQVPHYHAREVSFMRARMENARVILGSGSPSLEAFQLSDSGKIKYLKLPRHKSFPEVKTFDQRAAGSSFRKNQILPRYLEDAIIATLEAKGKTLLFVNRRGFATFSHCRNCGRVLGCPRCNLNLVYHFKEGLLRCRRCNYKAEPPAICPDCNSSYIRYSGAGAEKVESELVRIFPQARVRRLEKAKDIGFEEGDIFVSTQAIFKQKVCDFDLIGVLFIDNSLNRPDLRASEKVFRLLSGLVRLTEKKLLINTGLADHRCFRALKDNDPELFYRDELKERKDLGFPPYRHMGMVRLRGKNQVRVKQTSGDLYKKLRKASLGKEVEVVSCNRQEPAKLRSNYYWQILVSSASAKGMSRFLKNNLKDFPHSGIIVTVDIDPV
ncbi:primosomal protein N' [Candidatus Omnitrophota bacterium]